MSIVISKGPSGETLFVFCATLGELKKQVKQLNNEKQKQPNRPNRETGISVAGTMPRSGLISLLNE